MVSPQTEPFLPYPFLGENHAYQYPILSRVSPQREPCLPYSFKGSRQREPCLLYPFWWEPCLPVPHPFQGFTTERTMLTISFLGFHHRRQKHLLTISFQRFSPQREPCLPYPFSMHSRIVGVSGTHCSKWEEEKMSSTGGTSPLQKGRQRPSTTSFSQHRVWSAPSVGKHRMNQFTKNTASSKAKTKTIHTGAMSWLHPEFQLKARQGCQLWTLKAMGNTQNGC